MFVAPTFSLLVAIRHIGRGAIGKLRLIVERLPNARVTIRDDAHAVALTRDYLGPPHVIEASPPAKFDVSLVINDPPAVNGITDLGVPVVFLDSLSYVRKNDAEFPPLDRVACYCAQKYPVELFPVAPC